jgi:hypothetical protein
MEEKEGGTWREMNASVFLFAVLLFCTNNIPNSFDDVDKDDDDEME